MKYIDSNCNSCLHTEEILSVKNSFDSLKKDQFCYQVNTPSMFLIE